MKASKFQSLNQDWDNLGLQDLINVQIPEQEVSTIEFALLAKIQQKCLNEAGCLDLQFSTQLVEQTLQSIQSNLTLAGFIEISYDQSSSTIKCKKPSFPKGKSVKEISQWKEAAQNFEKGEVSEFINEENLLQEEEKNVLFQKFQDCMTKPKPCANCTCGRKEQYEQDMQALQQTNQPPVKSNCGKCALGDAFRCEGCPYRGMPAFNPGEEPELPTSVSQKGKVTIQL